MLRVPFTFLVFVYLFIIFIFFAHCHQCFIIERSEVNCITPKFCKFCSECLYPYVKYEFCTAKLTKVTLDQQLLGMPYKISSRFSGLFGIIGRATGVDWGVDR